MPVLLINPTLCWHSPSIVASFISDRYANQTKPPGQNRRKWHRSTLTGLLHCANRDCSKRVAIGAHFFVSAEFYPFKSVLYLTLLTYETLDKRRWVTGFQCANRERVAGRPNQTVGRLRDCGPGQKQSISVNRTPISVIFTLSFHI